MSLAICLHNWIDKHNLLKDPTDQIDAYFLKHPTAYKVGLIAAHILRVIPMAALMAVLPCSAPLNIGICLTGALYYRLTVERNCAYKFALPSFVGPIALLAGQMALISLISGAAFSSLKAFAFSIALLSPISTYIPYVALTISYDVDDQVLRKQAQKSLTIDESCCCSSGYTERDSRSV